jgi:(2Fe-2S) ferredoxin
LGGLEYLYAFFGNCFSLFLSMNFRTYQTYGATMETPNTHLLVCASFRLAGTPQGVCFKKGSGSLLAYLETEISDRGLEGLTVTATGCLKVCDRGPAMIVHPGNVWYGGVESEADVDQILDAIEAGEIAEKYVLMKG